MGKTLRGAFLVTLILASSISAIYVHQASSARARTMQSRDSRARALKVVLTPTPSFRVPRFETGGSFPQIADRVVELSHVNAALLAVVLADQKAFAPAARRAAQFKSNSHGLYRLTVDHRLLSASTVVVSALLPATERLPGGSLGEAWVSMTVRVPSGQRVGISELFANPAKGIAAVARLWKEEIKRTYPGLLRPCVLNHANDYAPTPHNYRYFALTPTGLAVGFWQEAACIRLHATIPYSSIRPYLSSLGRSLVAGVRSAQT